MNVRILDYTGSSGSSHYTVAWVTTAGGTFIKSLRKQGPSSWTSSEWGNHCRTWNTNRAGSTALDGYTSGTAANYSGTNSPINLVWNCRDTNNVLMPDGNYKFWVQYAENSGQGPYTTSGLLWTKGPVASTNTYPAQSVNFTDMTVTWTPATVRPTITSTAPPGTATVGVPYNFTCSATGTAPITFTATGLPTGLSMSAAGVISGIPNAAGAFGGTITAANGTLPNATQPFGINVSVVPAIIASIQTYGANVVLTGTGPANGQFVLFTATSPSGAPWTPVTTNTFDGTGLFRLTNAISAGTSPSFYRLRIP